MTFATLGMSVASPAAARDAELGRGVRLRRSRSEPLLRCCLRVPLATASPRLKTSRSIGAFPLGISGSVLPSSIRSLIFEPEDVGLLDAEEGKEEMGAGFQEVNAPKKRANWVQRIWQIRSRWKDLQAKNGSDKAEAATWEDDNGCGVSYESEEQDEEEKREWGREEFATLLNMVSWTETKLFSQLAFLCNIAYVIPEIKADELSRYYGLRLVTSSLDKKQEAAIKSSLDADSTPAPWPERVAASSSPSVSSSSAAYEIAATAASYIHNKAKSLLYLGAQAPNGNGDAANYQFAGKGRTYKSKRATYVAASSVTAVVAAEDKARLEAARELQSLHTSPCEWFVCDEPSSCTRCFVIQGSDSLASWQANLLFEPTKFEETEALVHRGIYEAAKGIYQQFVPEIESHIVAHGQNARFRFTGHSLGGSLSLLISLMLLARNAIPLSALLPVVTFGSPAVFCCGHRALEALGLDDTYIRAVMMHRDIVPRAFSCDYPNHVANVLKRLNSSFRAHTCLNTEKLLYFPIGKQYILQPDDKSSPPHPLLPSGAALYTLDGDIGRGALRAFLNSPHPLETLSHPTAYGSDGAILRDHDSSNYLIAVNALLRQHTRVLVHQSGRQRMNNWRPLVTGSTAAHGSLPVHTWAKHLMEPVK